MIGGRPLVPSLIKVILIAITAALIFVFAYPRNDQHSDHLDDQLDLIQTSNSSTGSSLSKTDSTTDIEDEQTIQMVSGPTKIHSLDSIPKVIHNNGLCLSPGHIGVSQGDSWTLTGTRLVIGSDGEEVAKDTVKTFVVDRIDDAQWTVDGRLVLVKESKAVIRSLSWGISGEEPLDSSPNVEELVLPTIKVTDLSPILTLDWECHKQAWMDGRVVTQEAGDVFFEPALEESTLDSGLPVVIFSTTQMLAQSGDNTMQTLEQRWAYDKRTGRLAHFSETSFDVGTGVSSVIQGYVISPDSPDATMMIGAPIEKISIDEYWTGALGGWSLTIVSSLPDSCWSLVDGMQTISSDSIQVEINNILNTHPNMNCDQMYKSVTTNIPITGIKACKVYTANVNDIVYAVQAIDTNVGCGATAPQLDQEYALPFGAILRFASEGLRVGFMDLQEDSRCPSDVTCSHVGQAMILMDTAHDSSRLLGGFTLTVGNDLEAASEKFQGYTVTLINLDPYPISTQEIRPQDYIATVVVTKP